MSRFTGEKRVWLATTLRRLPATEAALAAGQLNLSKTTAIAEGLAVLADDAYANVAADQYDVVLGFARVFDAKKDWPDAQSAYRVAMKIAVLNYVKDPSATSWRDKAEEAERASVVAGKAAETTAADTPH